MTEPRVLVHPLGDRWLTEVDRLVQPLRGRKITRFNLQEISRRAEVVLETQALQPGLLGLTLDSERVLLNQGLSGSLAAFTFAHELAHVYRRRGYFAGLRVREEEWFADWFAREMLLPRSWLSQSWRAQHLAALHIDSETAALQLSVLGRAPAIMRVRNRVLCRTCGTQHHRAGCQCATIRSAPSSIIQALPPGPNFKWRVSHSFQQLAMFKAPFDPPRNSMALLKERDAAHLADGFSQAFSQRAW
jgi:hypothetical protein